MTTHGIRRAAEMREVAITLDDLDIDGFMTAGSINWQEHFGNLGISLLETEGLERRIDSIQRAIETKQQR